MSGLILPARFTKQPQSAAPIERLNPITRGIVLAGSVGGQLKDSAAGSLWTNSGGATVENCVAGKAWKFDGATNGLIRNDDLIGVTNRAFSIGMVFVPRSSTIDTAIFAVGSSVTTTQYFVLAVSDAAASTARLFFRNDVGTSMEISVPNSFVQGRATTVLAVVDGNSTTLYTNAGKATGTSPAGPITLDRTGLGCNYRNGTTGGFTNCQIPAWFALNRPLTEREAWAVIANPWQLYKAPPRRLWIGASASGSTYNVDAADSITSTDAATQQLTAPAAATDAASAADSATNLGVLVRSASDAAAATDTASNALTIAASTTDAASATDSTTSASAVNSAATDAISATDAATQLAVLPAAVSDSVSAADAASNIATMPAAATDAATATDSATGLRITTAAATDAATATDSASQVNAVNVAATDAISAADAATVQAVLAGIVSDGFSAIDAATLLAGIYNLTAADVLSLLDAALADGGVQYARAPQGAGQDLIYPGGHRPAVISGNRPGNINTARPANRGGRRT